MLSVFKSVSLNCSKYQSKLAFHEHCVKSCTLIHRRQTRNSFVIRLVPQTNRHNNGTFLWACFSECALTLELRNSTGAFCVDEKFVKQICRPSSPLMVCVWRIKTVRAAFPSQGCRWTNQLPNNLSKTSLRTSSCWIQSNAGDRITW